MGQNAPKVGKPKRKGRPRTDVGIENHIRKLTLEGRSPVQIRRNLEANYRAGKVGHVPAIRTIQRLATPYAPKDPTAQWSLAEADTEDAALILPVLAEVLQRTEGRVRLTQERARWVAKVARLASGLDPWSVYVTAAAYERRAADGKDTEDLDALLALAPWRGDEAEGSFWRWVRRHRPAWVHDEPADPFYGLVEGTMIAIGIWGDRNTPEELKSRLSGWHFTVLPPKIRDHLWGDANNSHEERGSDDDPKS